MIDEEGRLTGLITVKDFVKTQQYPNATKDANGKDKADLGKLYTDCTAVFDPDVNFAVNGGVQGINLWQGATDSVK